MLNNKSTTQMSESCSSSSSPPSASSNLASSSILSSSPIASSSDPISYPCDDIWKKFDDFLLTPPQSPPVSLDDSSFDPLLDDALSVVMNDLNESTSTTSNASTVTNAVVYEPTGPIEFLHSLQADDSPTNVLRDCMWSGACVEDCMQTNSLCQLALLDSSFNQILACHNDTLAISGPCGEESDEEIDPATMEVEEEVEDSEESEDERYSRMATVSDSLLDHSYGTSHMSPHPRLPITSSSHCTVSSVANSPPTTPCPSPRSSTSSQGSISLIEPSSRPKKMVKKQHSTASLMNNMTTSTPFNSNSTSQQQMTNSSLRPQRQRVPKKRKDELLTPVSVKFVKSRILTPSKEPIIKHKIVCKSPQRRKNTIASLSLSCNNTKSSYLSPSPTSSSSCSSPPLPSSPNSFHLVASSLSPSASSQSSMSYTSSSPHSPTSVLSSTSFTSATSLLRSKHKNLPPERRRDHNDNEKKRRDQLRGAFHCLRDQVPKLKDSNRKPPRIVILHEASAYVKIMVDKQKDLDKVKKAELARNQKLLKKLASLRSLAP